TGSPRPDAARRYLHRQDPQGGQTGRAADRAGFQVPAGHQSEDREGARPDDPAVAPPTGRRGDPVMDRRAFLAGAAALLAAPLAAEAQQATKVWRIGYLGYTYPSQARDLDAFRERLRDLGYIERKNLVIESRSAELSFERLPALAAELVSLKLDVIAAIGNRTIMALMRATQTIPIVMIRGGDPVGTGLVSSLAHPGGNVTGLSNLAEGLSAKWLELLTEAAPGIARVGVLMEPAGSAHATFLREIKTAGQRTGIAVFGLEAQGRDEIERAFAALTRERAQGLIVL